jgi:hypothetical protein
MRLMRRFLGLDKIHLIEVPLEVNLGEEARAAVRRLPDHPGFQYLMQQLRRRKAAIDIALRGCPKKDLTRLQEAHKAACWLEAYVKNETKINEARKKEVSLTRHDEEILAKSLANIEMVGV